MNNELDGLMNRFSLKEDVDNDVFVEEDEGKDYVEDVSLRLFGKVMILKPINLEAMCGVFARAWQVKSGLEVTEIGNQIFLFKFFDLRDKARVWFHEP